MDKHTAAAFTVSGDPAIYDWDTGVEKPADWHGLVLVYCSGGNSGVLLTGITPDGERFWGAPGKTNADGSLRA